MKHHIKSILYISIALFLTAICFSSCGNNTIPDDKETATDRKTAEIKGPAFIINNVSAHPGDQDVAVDIYVKNNPGIASIALTLSYDDDFLRLAGYSFNPQIGGQSVSYNPNVSDPKLVWMNWSGNVDGDWKFATLYFEVFENTPQGNIPISVIYNPDDIYDFEENNIDFGIVGGSILVK